jgi:CDP-diacylglycerol--serine O-phosphatidyltransferase
MMIRQFLNPPNWFTSASLFCGLYAILLAGSAAGDPGHFYKAGLMIFFAGLFDGLDGRVARMTGTGSAFGVQLDSLVDIISFGVAPSCLVYFWGLQHYGLAGVFVAGMLMLCGAFRLARFNVSTDGKAHATSEGLTITAGGGTVASVVMWYAGKGWASAPDARTLVVLVACIAFLEVSSIPFHTTKALRMSPKTMAALVVFAAACLAVGARYDISTVLVVLGMGHVVSGPLLLAWTWPQRRRRRRRMRDAERAAHEAERARGPASPEVAHRVQETPDAGPPGES